MPAPASPSRLRRRALLCSGALLCLYAAIAGAQSNLGFLRNTPLAYFNETDSKMMRAAAAKVLENGHEGAHEEWTNPATGNGGAITLLAQYKSPDGRPCNQVRVENHAKAMENTSIMSVCKSTAGQWKLEPTKPPQ
jgi:surface antigen